MSRIGIEHDAGLRAQSDPAGIGGLQVNVYVDIRSVEHCEDFAARREDFAHIGNAVLDAPLLRRDKGIVEDVGSVEFDVVRGCVERLLRLGDLVVGHILRGNGSVHLLTPLIEQLDGGKPLRDEGARAIELLLRQR